MGKAVRKFEIKVSKMFSKKYGLMVNSGSSALTLAMQSLNLKKNDEIITPCLNFGTAVSSIVIAGAKPVFVDIDIETLQIDVNKIEEKITKRTVAFLIPNLIGNIPDIKKIYKLKNKYNLKLIEDSADTLGAKIRQKSTGHYSDISITSFYGSHIISCAGNGGMLMTNNKIVYEKSKVLRSWGRMSSLIKNSENISERLNIKSFGLEQLKKFHKFSKKRLVNFNYHKKFFNKYKSFFISPMINKDIQTNFLAYPLIIKENKIFKRKDLQIYLEENNIQTRPIFSGNILRHPAFKYLISYKNKIKNFKNSDYIMRNGILIGCHQGLDLKNLDYIHGKVSKFIKSCN